MNESLEESSNKAPVCYRMKELSSNSQMQASSSSKEEPLVRNQRGSLRSSCALHLRSKPVDTPATIFSSNKVPSPPPTTKKRRSSRRPNKSPPTAQSCLPSLSLAKTTRPRCIQSTRRGNEIARSKSTVWKSSKQDSRPVPPIRQTSTTKLTPIEPNDTKVSSKQKKTSRVCSRTNPPLVQAKPHRRNRSIDDSVPGKNPRHTIRMDRSQPFKTHKAVSSLSSPEQQKNSVPMESRVKKRHKQSTKTKKKKSVKCNRPNKYEQENKILESSLKDECEQSLPLSLLLQSASPLQSKNKPLGDLTGNGTPEEWKQLVVTTPSPVRKGQAKHKSTLHCDPYQIGSRNNNKKTEHKGLPTCSLDDSQLDLLLSGKDSLLVHPFVHDSSISSLESGF